MLGLLKVKFKEIAEILTVLYTAILVRV